MNNNREGCCSETAFAKWLGMIASYRPGGKTLVATDAEVSAFYHAVTGPGDNGTYMVDMFEYAMTKGFKIGGVVHKIAGYASIDVRDTATLDAGMHWFIGVQLGVNLTQKQYSNFANGTLWTFDGSRVVGGHSIPLTKRDADKFRLATWAQQPDVERACVQNPAWAEEAYVCISQEMVDADKHGPNNVDWSAFLSAMEDIKAGRVPTIPDDPNPPGPGPNPPRPGGPGTFSADAVLTLLGQSVPAHLTGTFTTALAAAPLATVNYWAVAADVAQLIRDLLKRDWVAMAMDVEQLLTDLGIQFTAEDLLEIS